MENNTVDTSRDFKVIINLLEGLNTDIKDMKDTFTDFGCRLIEHEKQIEEHNKQIQEHEERLNKHDTLITQIDKRKKFNGTTLLGYLGYILAFIGIGINLIR